MSREEPPNHGQAVVPYEVGYSKPPTEYRFQKGASGNPGGRPRGKKPAKVSGLNADRANALLLEEAYRPVVLREGDKIIELPAIQAVFRAMGVSAMKGNRFAQKTLSGLVAKIEAERTEQLTKLFESAVDYKIRWECEIDRCRRGGLSVPEPLPHPDDILIDPRDGRVKFAGPMSTEEKAYLDGVLNLMKLIQVQVSEHAETLRRARSRERRQTLLAELHLFQKKFDEFNDVIAPRYRMELRDRSHAPGASRPGEFAKKMGINLPGPSPPLTFPDEVMQLIADR